MICEFFLLLLSLQSAWDEIIALVVSTAFPLALSNLIVIGFFIYLYWYDCEEQNKYEGRIAQLEDSSKRAQMNPHFIFNALNGMQIILLLQGEQKANQYLGMLSKLLRYTLDNSVQERIALADELNYLKAYIELNKMRMGDSFEYCIDSQIDVDPKECYIPPMLIQPIVENAIVPFAVNQTTHTITIKADAIQEGGKFSSLTTTGTISDANGALLEIGF